MNKGRRLPTQSHAASTEHALTSKELLIVILLSPGCGNTSGLHDPQASDLSSHGYVVVGIDHPCDTTAVDAGGGQILTMNPAAERIQDKSAVQRVADVHYVLHHLGAAVHGAGRLDR